MVYKNLSYEKLHFYRDTNLNFKLNSKYVLKLDLEIYEIFKK